MNFRLCRKNGQPQELDDCDLCVEFAHFLSNFRTLGKKTKNMVICFCGPPYYAMIALVPSWVERVYFPTVSVRDEMALKAGRCGLWRAVSDYGKGFGSDKLTHIEGKFILAQLCAREFIVRVILFAILVQIRRLLRNNASHLGIWHVMVKGYVRT